VCSGVRGGEETVGEARAATSGVVKKIWFGLSADGQVYMRILIWAVYEDCMYYDANETIA
jgi:hypothetical protein